MNNIAFMLDKVIMQLNDKIKTETESKKLELLLEKYQSAKIEFETTGEIKTDLIGGVRAYLDSYSDYMNNSLLDDMYDIEKLIKNHSR